MKANRSAFPVTLTPQWMDQLEDKTPDGLTIRDYIAIQAMDLAGIYVSSPNSVAKLAYEYADAMIAESEHKS